MKQNKQGWFGGSELHKQGLTKNVFDSLDNWEYPTLIPLSSKMILTNFGNGAGEVLGAGKSVTSVIDIF